MVDVAAILRQVQAGRLSVEEAEELLAGTSRLEYATLDLDRARRTGFPEVVYAAGKTAEQLVGIFSRLREHQTIVLATRVTAEQAEAVLTRWPDVQYVREAGLLIGTSSPLTPVRDGYVAVVTAGTSDWPVAQEAAWTVRCFGSEARVIADVGVAGINRLFQRLDEIREAAVIICIAGMEGALASVIAGLVDKPVIAVPTSVGYGAHFNGLAPLLSMLNSCANGVAVVNIDNGFGAGYLAGMIHRQIAAASLQP
ncbi:MULTISPECIES: nickel pincer cofactor biosynthesis protein LarB [Bacillales]|jgi:pyridinium-3,5-biscarboxylic acid mononucleotide synthase|uniref:Nickel pincer cofactor biosynthesis protein LarB n=1 Tax=Brevibacillus aydinogluensis TaxID=927786 RepID=A0AA48M968_9BACL|nr:MULTISPECIES: nickel pincer cofactor biosynthesis protein LarB [Bacillales]MBR8660132.1 nickel pincer cofactor biosynthesis protein LarB [Brevibacillus sp. NL20B1]MDT3414213.1 NCAIR mutase (PurE)-related protein [Brevibacillus aydinogluensis]NNV03689.1 nickel pincer cofactor biosynthesis protein LarB [Brevibacillus sp. MCWH]UFJ59819.1 nickel pincer cofactor biosynthesis protein LarB [Anoxybacillus sediminis]CAJ1003571.1 nickel pincer cofactor biosynthesis protein LarB [Brevibacillus aydinog